MITPIQVPAFVEGLQTRVPKKIRGISVLKWLKADGDLVADGEPIVVLHTKKVAVELVATASGLLFQLMEVGKIVKAGVLLGVIVDSVEEFNEYRKNLLNEVA
jgi:pyruvate/2-oxoglutarate dehydrogenase complex dihydrolipoamide acyltransferase (E2) component